MTKHRFVTLDGLRGVATLSIFVFHLFRIPALAHYNLLPSTYLAVDFFFLLSGFVVAKAYEPALLAGQSFLQFVKIRLIRLYPMIVLGMAIGFGAHLYKALLDSPYQGPAPAQLWQQLARGLFLVPALPTEANPYVTIYPLNNPAWSLFYELVSNFLWALLLPWLRTRTLCLVVLGLAGCMGYTACQHNGFDLGVLTIQYQGGLLRAVFSFFFGTLLARLHGSGRAGFLAGRSGFWPAAMLVLTFFPGGHAQEWVYDMFCVLLLYPVILLAGAGARLPGPASRVALLLGELSYAIYATHFPLYIENAAPYLQNLHGAALVLAITLAVAMVMATSWLINHFYEKPIRRFLIQRFAPAPRQVKAAE
jgi:peptidoglycan/LPS O-acetylase OafA/YrhL